ncbi:hypothetical protein [Peristeroidobacter soli]|jgi:hypothetical protein|nr:hypothetical protein [Peristeroidobacter soli]
MAFVLITLTASLILNLAVLALLKIGLQSERGSAGDFSGHLPC